MSKVVIAILACFLGLTSAATTPLSDTTTEVPVPCMYKDELWGTEDGTKFYYCLAETNTALIQSCPEETFFVRNTTVTGCIPNYLMDAKCVYDTKVGNCTGDNLRQPQTSSEPDKFYLCTGEGASPLLLPCADGKAFVKENGYLGCFNWPTWRTLRQCFTLSNQK